MVVIVLYKPGWDGFGRLFFMNFEGFKITLDVTVGDVITVGYSTKLQRIKLYVYYGVSYIGGL